MNVILAGNRREYLFHRESRDDIYASHPERLMGLTDFEYKTVGTFWQRPDAYRIYDEARIRHNRSAIIEKKEKEG